MFRSVFRTTCASLASLVLGMPLSAAQEASPSPADAIYEEIKSTATAQAGKWDIYGFQLGMEESNARALIDQIAPSMQQDTIRQVRFETNASPLLIGTVTFDRGTVSNLVIERRFGAGVTIDTNLLRQDIIAKYGEPSSINFGDQFVYREDAPRRIDVRGQCQSEYIARGGNQFQAMGIANNLLQKNSFSHASIAQLLATCPGTVEEFKKLMIRDLGPNLNITLPRPTQGLLFTAGFFGAGQFKAADDAKAAAEQAESQPKARL